MNKLILIAGLLLAASQSRAAEPAHAQDIAKICTTTACRPGGYEVAVQADKGRFAAVPVGQSPYVTPDNDILIYPGETLVISFTVADGKATAPTFVKQYATSSALAVSIVEDGKAVSNPTDKALPAMPMKADGLPDYDALPANSIVLSYGQSGQMAAPGHGPATILNIFNTLPQTVKLDAHMSLLSPNGLDWKKTSICPVVPRTFGLEMWPMPLGPMVVTLSGLIKPTDSMVCD